MLHHNIFDETEPFGLTRNEQELLNEEQTQLSEERTLLSYIRTSLALIGVGLVVLNFWGEGFGHGVWIAVVLFVLAIVIVVEEIYRIKRLRERRIEVLRQIYGKHREKSTAAHEQD